MLVGFVVFLVLALIGNVLGGGCIFLNNCNLYSAYMNIKYSVVKVLIESEELPGSKHVLLIQTLLTFLADFPHNAQHSKYCQLAVSFAFVVYHVCSRAEI